MSCGGCFVVQGVVPKVVRSMAEIRYVVVSCDEGVFCFLLKKVWFCGLFFMPLMIASIQQKNKKQKYQ